jgi:hypothetical protein
MDHDIEQTKGIYEVAPLYFCTIIESKNNFFKSEVFYFEQAKECEAQYSQLFGCKVGSYPFQYLGTPMNIRKIK